MGYTTRYIADQVGVKSALMKNNAGAFLLSNDCPIPPFPSGRRGLVTCVNHHHHHHPGTTVDSTIAAVEAALDEVIDKLESDYLGLDVINGNNSASWPMCMVSFVLVNVSNNLPDCSYIQGLMKFIAWSQLNPRVIAAVKSDLNMAPLPFGYKKYIFANLPHPLLG